MLGTDSSPQKLNRLDDRLLAEPEVETEELASHFISWLNETSGLDFEVPPAELEKARETENNLESGPVGAELDDLLQSRFAHDSFRSGQKEAIQHVLNGTHCLLVMPTGGGKSLCYQLPSLALAGTTLVISPLISLMKDQVDSLQEQGISATNINSSFSRPEQLNRLDDVRDGLYDLVYVAPERLEDRDFRAALAGLEIDLLAVDEAHCISKWGYDFRPAYRRIPEAHKAVGAPPVLATTATATPRVQQDIRKQLQLVRMEQIVKGFNRPNLYLEVEPVESIYAKRELLADFFADFSPPGSAIVYVGTRDETIEVADFLENRTGLTCRSYHGGMGKERRKAIQRDFLADRAPVMVATNAFGMGIDKPNIRVVVHYRFPGTVEAYYQEAGRAGRDGKPARCLLFYRPADKELQEWFIRNDAPGRKELFRLYDVLLDLKDDSPLPESAGGKLVYLPETLRQLCDLTDVQLQTGLSLLEQAGWIEDCGYRGPKRYLKLRQENQDQLKTVLGRVRKRRRQKREKLRKMVKYAKIDTCRREYILDYFGDDSQCAVEKCCDNCTGKNSPEDDLLSSTEKLILATVAELETPLGVRKLAMILAGSEARSICERGLDELTVYGKLEEETQKNVRKRIEALLERGLLRQKGDYRPVVVFTEKGQQLAQESEVPAAQSPCGDSSPPTGSGSRSEKQAEPEIEYPPF